MNLARRFNAGAVKGKEACRVATPERESRVLISPIRIVRRIQYYSRVTTSDTPLETSSFDDVLFDS